MNDNASNELPDVQKGVTDQPCCGKWVVFDVTLTAPAWCTCTHPADNGTAIDAFLDHHDALFGQRFAA